jgi:hypothetical protein
MFRVITSLTAGLLKLVHMNVRKVGNYQQTRSDFPDDSNLQLCVFSSVLFIAVLTVKIDRVSSID